MCSLTLLAMAAFGPIVNAQDKMAKPMEMGQEKSDTGCIEAGAMAGSFKLTHAEAAMAMDAMGKDSMKKDAMGKDMNGFTVTALKMVAATCGK